MRLVITPWNWSAFRRKAIESSQYGEVGGCIWSLSVCVEVQQYYNTAEYGAGKNHVTSGSLRVAHERAGRMQLYLLGVGMMVISTGTQVVDDAMTVGTHVAVTIGSLIMMGVTSSVDTIVETLNVEITDIPKRVAVGVCWQAMRRK